MPSVRLFIVLSGTFLGMAALYGPQPLLPLLSRSFSISIADAASLITWSLLAMSVGPIAMGFLLQKFSARNLLSGCLIALALSEYLFVLSDAFILLKAVRFIQGAFIAALLSATMTYLASTAAQLRKALALYVGSSVLGGLAGRLLAGFMSGHLSWPAFFMVMGIAFLIAALASFRLPVDEVRKGTSISIQRLFDVVRDGYILRVFGIIVLSFFAMTGLLNYVPFRLEEIVPTLGESIISLFYLGFLVSFGVSANAPRISDLLGGEIHAIWTGIVLIGIGMIVALLPSGGWVFVAVLLMTSGFFLQHATAAAMLNAYAGDRAGDVNSLYVSFYYLGGTAGSYVPGLLYVWAGWGACVSGLAIVLFMATALAFRMKSPSGTYPLTLS